MKVQLKKEHAATKEVVEVGKACLKGEKRESEREREREREGESAQHWR